MPSNPMRTNSINPRSPGSPPKYFRRDGELARDKLSLALSPLQSRYARQKPISGELGELGEQDAIQMEAKRGLQSGFDWRDLE